MVATSDDWSRQTLPFHARCRAILGRVYAGFIRPGTVEDLWYIDGLLDRLRALDE